MQDTGTHPTDSVSESAISSDTVTNPRNPAHSRIHSALYRVKTVESELDTMRSRSSLIVDLLELQEARGRRRGTITNELESKYEVARLVVEDNEDNLHTDRLTCRRFLKVVAQEIEFAKRALYRRGGKEAVASAADLADETADLAQRLLPYARETLASTLSAGKGLFGPDAETWAKEELRGFEDVDDKIKYEEKQEMKQRAAEEQQSQR